MTTITVLAASSALFAFFVTCYGVGMGAVYLLPLDANESILAIHAACFCGFAAAVAAGIAVTRSMKMALFPGPKQPPSKQPQEPPESNTTDHRSAETPGQE